jgi:hypothetical protein
MSAIRYYIVTQEREIKISANNSTDAAALAERVFSATKKPEDQLRVQQYPRETILEIREDLYGNSD